jgi:hypothetical protein
VAASIADVHNVDKEGQASMAHTDINPKEFVWHNGMYRLNDFNRAQFLAWSRKGNKPCGYSYGTNYGKVRRSLSPLTSNLGTLLIAASIRTLESLP